MKFAWIRYVSLLLVLCVSVCLMSSFVFAASDVYDLTFQYNFDDFCYYSNSSSDLVNLAIDCFNNKWPVSLSFVGLGDFNFSPSDYHISGSAMLFSVPDDVIGFGIDTVEMDIVALIPPGFKETLGLPDTLSGSFSYDIPPSPSSGFLSDLQLTGSSFLQTVQGIVLTICKNPLLLLTVGIFFVGGCIAIFIRVLSKN